MRIKFTKDAIYETEGYRKGPTYKAGETHDFSEDFAQRWIRRGVAVSLEKPDATVVTAKK